MNSVCQMRDQSRPVPYFLTSFRRLGMRCQHTFISQWSTRMSTSLFFCTWPHITCHHFQQYLKTGMTSYLCSLGTLLWEAIALPKAIFFHPPLLLTTTALDVRVLPFEEQLLKFGPFLLKLTVLRDVIMSSRHGTECTYWHTWQQFLDHNPSVVNILESGAEPAQPITWLLLMI
jgi:hypothetical protein